MTKRHYKWLALGLVLLLIAFSVVRALSARKAQQEALAQADAAKVQAVVELAASDVIKAETRELAQGLPISGSLRAINSALVKARAAGELQGLTVREGDVVKAGQIIARVDATEYGARVRQAQEQADSAKAQIDIAAAPMGQQQGAGGPGLHLQDRLGHLAQQFERRAGQRTRPRWPPSRWRARRSTTRCCVRPSPASVAQRLAQPGERVARRRPRHRDRRPEPARARGHAGRRRLGRRCAWASEAALQIEGSACQARARREVAARSIRARRRAAAACWPTWCWPSEGLRQGLFAQGTLDVGRTRGAGRCRCRRCASTSPRRTCRRWSNGRRSCTRQVGDRAARPGRRPEA